MRERGCYAQDENKKIRCKAVQGDGFGQSSLQESGIAAHFDEEEYQAQTRFTPYWYS